MNYQLHVIDNGYCYEATCSGYTILRLVRYAGYTQLRKEVDFDALPESVKDAIVDKMKTYIDKIDDE